MALDTYAGLQAATGTWNVNRTDLPTADLIALGEARLNRDLRLRVMETESTLVGVVSSRYIALPSTFLEQLALWLNLTGSGRDALTFVSAESMPNWPSNCQPQYWTIDGTNVAFEGPVDQAYSFTLRYLARFKLSTTAPADGTQTNWLLTNHPDIYLAAANIEAALWLQDDEQAVRWQARYSDALGSISAKEAQSRRVALRTDTALARMGQRRSGFNIFRGT